MNVFEKSIDCIDVDFVFEELDCLIIEKEIVDVIKCLKKEKLYGIDLLINEYFIEFKDYFVLFILRLFNRILFFGFFFNMWVQCIIILVFKKGDVLDFNNYRGISFVSCFCKLFIFILN